MSKDMVKRPDHYCFSKFEPKDVIREWGLNFNLGSAVKYIARAGRKDDIVGSFSGICMICMCVVGGSGDESGADSNIEEEHKPEA